jgi:hypothetical protein
MQSRRYLLVLLLAATLPALAYEPTTVAQLEQTLAATMAAGHEKSNKAQDQALVKQLGDMELTERLSTLRLQKLQATLPGPKSRQTLQVLSDASAFLPLPAADFLPSPAPDRGAQSKILSKTTDYIRDTLTRLPNFIVTRNTLRYDNLKVDFSFSIVSVVEDQPFHFLDANKETVTYRDGKETVLSSSRHYEHERGQYSQGVFGPMIQEVVTDIFDGKMGWGHWEQGPTGPMAVFRYAVPREKSHYKVKYCCFSATNSWHTFEDQPAYHGEIGVDPDSGAILRMAVETEIPANGHISRVDTVVEYGPVEIAGQQYTCPTRSVSISKTVSTVLIKPVRCQDSHCTPADLTAPQNTSINDVAYNAYHLFRSEIRLLPTDDADTQPVPNPKQAPVPAQPAPPAALQ